MKTRSNGDVDEAEGNLASSAMRADGLLGFEDEAEDAAAGRSGREGDTVRTSRAERVYGSLERDNSGPERGSETETDQDTGDLTTGVDEDALDEDELDTDRVTRTEALAAAMRIEAMRHEAERRNEPSHR